MSKRFMSIWFRHLKTDWFTRQQPALKTMPFVLAAPDHGRMIVTAVNMLAQSEGIHTGITVADARALVPSLHVLDDQPELPGKLLQGIATYGIRYTPVIAVDPPDGLILDVTGCAHLWKGEQQYRSAITRRFNDFGYAVKIAIADTIGTAWAMARFGQDKTIVEPEQQTAALLPLSPSSLRLDPETIERLEKLGLRTISSFISMPKTALRRRFGKHILLRLDQALGHEAEALIPVQPVEPYQERLPCLEPIVTATGIEIALQRLLDALCKRLMQEEKGLRIALFKCYRVDGRTEQINIGTNRPSHNAKHLFKLFENKINTIEPALGIELFTLDAQKVEALSPLQQKMWEQTGGLDDIHLAELLDRIAGKVGADCIHRYVPDEHYWPERSFKKAASLNEPLQTTWKADRPRPIQLLSKPEPIQVTAPIPDYPPMSFRYKGLFHKITKADGPERIEQEWWLQEGQHRDYYYVEDEAGQRYWLFRSGHYEAAYQWFIHGFFA